MHLPLLLADENFPAPSIRSLRGLGLNVLAIAERSPGISDQAVLDLAHREQRWLLTCDRDFGELIFARNLPPPPAIILVREQDYFALEPSIWVTTLLESTEALEGGFFVVDMTGMRWRPFETSPRREGIRKKW